MKWWAAVPVALGMSVWSLSASAQTDNPSNQQSGWQAATSVTAVSAMAVVTVMPRIFYSDPETTVGWKARFHVSVLAPTLALTALTFLNEYYLKQPFGATRPGCTADGCPGGRGDPYETLSSHSFAAFSAFGQGTAVFLVDTIKWSDGRLNAGSLVGNVALPLVLAGITAAGRAAGNWEDTGSVLLSSGVGIVVGALTGVVYATMARPECGYTGDLLCW